MSNPWENVALSDYENHMSLDSVCQLPALNEIMKEQFGICAAKSVMILGIAGGNGLEHIDPAVVETVYGVDVNADYLDVCNRRYPQLQGVLKTLQIDLLKESTKLPQAELLIANLLVEYIGYECFKQVVEQVSPKAVSCVIQINTGESFVSASPYVHSFDCLEAVHHQMEEEALVQTMQKIGYAKKTVTERVLPNGKKFVRVDFEKFIYRLATLHDLKAIWNKNIADNPEDERWARWKEEYIGYNKSGMAQTFVVVCGDEPVGECTLLRDPACSAIRGCLELANGKEVANINALRIAKEFEGQGHVSMLMACVEEYAKEQEIQTLTIGVEAAETRNLAIYLHWGYDAFVMSETEDGVLVLYYKKALI